MHREEHWGLGLGLGLGWGVGVRSTPDPPCEQGAPQGRRAGIPDQMRKTGPVCALVRTAGHTLPTWSATVQSLCSTVTPRHTMQNKLPCEQNFCDLRRILPNLLLDVVGHDIPVILFLTQKVS